MNKKIYCVYLSLAIALSSCSVKLTAIPDKNEEQIKETYTIKKDILYGNDKEESMDLYLSSEAGKRGNKNFTIVFLHGGGYYISDKTREERYIQPYLKKGFNVVNMNYRLKKGIPLATEDLPKALNFLKTNSTIYNLNLQRIVVTGFSAGAHIASMAAVTANDPSYTNQLTKGIKIVGVINFSGPVDGLDVVENVFINNETPIMKEIGNALFPSTGYAAKELVEKYNPITYFDKNDPPFFIWHGGKDDQVPPVTFEKFVTLLQKNHKKNVVKFVPEGFHSPNNAELNDAYKEIFPFLDKQ